MQTNRGSSFIWALALAIAVTPLSAQKQKKGSLLDGLGVPENQEPAAPEYSPAEVKVNEGTFHLRWGIESMVMGNRSRSSGSDKGWVLLKNGETLEGRFSVKAKQGKKETRWTLTEIDFKDASDQKRRIAGADVEDFAYSFKIDDYTNGGKHLSKNPMNNFQPGTIVLPDGSQRAGLVAILTQFGVPGGHQLYFAADQNADIEQFKPKALAYVTQNRDDGEFQFVSFNGGIMPLIVNGQNFLYFRNPYSTTKATGMKGMLGNMASGIAADQAGKAVAKGAAKSEMQRQIKSGADLGTTVRSGAAAADDAYQSTSDAVSSGFEIGATKAEYVIRNVKTGFEVIVSDGNHIAKLGELMNACSAIWQMRPDERKEISRFKNLETLVRTLDTCF